MYMNNLEKIKKAWAMQYSATLKTNEDGSEFNVVFIGEGSFIAVNDSMTAEVCFENLEEYYTITGYKYGGDLAGDEPIPKGQKFRVKETGEIGKFTEPMREGLNLEFDDYDKEFRESEIEPVFE